LPLPTFLIIGAQKSATRWLRLNLGEHPDIYAAPTELSFFNNGKRFAARGPEGYAALFATTTETFVGEATPGYMMWRHRPAVVSERMRQTVPDVRLVAILRNPIDRAQSALVHHVHGGRLEPGARLLEVVRRTPPEKDKLGLVAGGWYAKSLAPYYDRFGDQLLVLLHDDARRDPRATYEDALAHIGAPLGFVPPGLVEVRFSRQSDTTDAPTAAERLELFEYFRADVAELEQRLGRDLTMWDPARAPEAGRESA
jgi:hypothetical protein